MKISLFTTLFFAISATLFSACLYPQASPNIPAFPGAEGFGANSIGGRGGRVLLVTHLRNSGPGSFRAACEAKGPRIVIFRVGGIIELSNRIIIQNPYLTIAGQTAPGDGICLRNYGIIISGGAHDVIIRGIRSRLGDLSRDKGDAGSIGAKSKNSFCSDIMIDHCSFSWSIDEIFSVKGWAKNVTVQWCFITEALDQSRHAKGAHGYGSIIGSDFENGGISVHHNLFAHGTRRMPRFAGNHKDRSKGPIVQCYNNVIYNFQHQAGGYGGRPAGANVKVNMIANYVKHGPSTRKPAKGQLLTLRFEGQPKFYLKDNFIYEYPEHTADNWKGVRYAKTRSMKEKTVRVDVPFPTPEVTYDTPEIAYEAVLARGGASVSRDGVDARIVEHVRTNTGAIINSQSEVGGWPEYKSGNPPTDSDKDGMPDDWEKAHGLNPTNPADGKKLNRDGYTNVEKYINGLIPLHASQTKK